MELRKKYGWEPEWHDDKEFPHELWKKAFKNLINKCGEWIKEHPNHNENFMDVAEEEAFEAFTDAWFEYRSEQEDKKDADSSG